MSNDANQIISPLTDDDQARLGDQRAVIQKFLGQNEDNLRKFQTTAGKLGTLRALLQGGVFKPDQTFELQCMGVVLGDAFVQELGMEWIIVEDQYGRDPAIRLPETSIILYPLTMISKRVEQGDTVDVFDLFNSVAAEIESIRAGGA